MLVVKTFFETGSIPGVQEAFRRRFPDRDPPVKSTIWYNVRKYKINGTSLDRHKGNSGRNRTSTSDGNVEAVRALLEMVHTLARDEMVQVYRNQVSIG